MTVTLPDEIVLEIAKQLPDKDAVALLTSNKQWRPLLDLYDFKNVYDVEKVPPHRLRQVTRVKNVSRLDQLQPWFTHVELHDQFNEPFPLDACPLLTTLILGNKYNKPFLVGLFPLLTTLTLG
jgi:hypothetical protein